MIPARRLVVVWTLTTLPPRCKVTIAKSKHSLNYLLLQNSSMATTNNIIESNSKSALISTDSLRRERNMHRDSLKPIAVQASSLTLWRKLSKVGNTQAQRVRFLSSRSWETGRNNLALNLSHCLSLRYWSRFLYKKRRWRLIARRRERS